MKQTKQVEQFAEKIVETLYQMRGQNNWEKVDWLKQELAQAQQEVAERLLQKVNKTIEEWEEKDIEEMYHNQEFGYEPNMEDMLFYGMYRLREALQKE